MQVSIIHFICMMLNRHFFNPTQLKLQWPHCLTNQLTTLKTITNPRKYRHHICQLADLAAFEVFRLVRASN